jgi:SHS2 domain-containing protein
MPYDYFEHEADIGIVGIGENLEESFQEAAKAMFNVMVDIEKIEPRKSIEVECEADNEEELLVEWLNALLTEKDINNMVFSEFKVLIDGKKLKGVAKGERFQAKKHNAKTEVKAATYSQLRVYKKSGKYLAQCVVDV